MTDEEEMNGVWKMVSVVGRLIGGGPEHVGGLRGQAAEPPRPWHHLAVWQ